MSGFSVRDLGGSTGLLRRELQIRVCIGDPSQKDKLSYISVKHQINEARKQGYAHSEIINSIIRGMHSSLRLKSILEMKQNLDMSRFATSLRRKKYPRHIDFCANVITATQMSNQTPVDFVLRCTELREKLLLSSIISREIEYDAHFV